MIEVSNVPLPLDAGLANEAAKKLMRKEAAKCLGVSPDQIMRVRVLKRSVDARKKTNVHFVATLGIDLDANLEKTLINQFAQRAGKGFLKGTQVKAFVPPARLEVPFVGIACQDVHPDSAIEGWSASERVLVVGTGPAGLFCALVLARAGLRPLVVERGSDVDARKAKVEAFNAGSAFDPQTNIQFGEGGAGTFSDGKLTTNIKSPYAFEVLNLFVEAGAPEEILWQAKPHIGTDLLIDVVRTLRRQIEAAGGEVLFDTQFVDVTFEDGHVVRACLEQASHAGALDGKGHQRRVWVDVSAVVCACGHSARDTFELLYESGVPLEQKPFSVGVRIEHPQALINEAQYGQSAQHPALGAADYKLAVHLQPTETDPLPRGVYTFCMCPGGEVVCAASEPETVVVNGMSEYARAGTNANSALLVSVEPADFGSDHPLAGVEFQRRIERAAYAATHLAHKGDYCAPVQTVGSFLQTDEKAPACVVPTYSRGTVQVDPREYLPQFVTDALVSALPLLDKKLHGFAHPSAVLTGPETRSSSPVRMIRNTHLQSELVPEVDSGIFPCGEGAGYAGGIMSAACDGVRVALQILEQMRHPDA